MNKEMQIEEMAGIVSKCMTSWLNNETPKSPPDYIAEALYNADYRKALEVAEEIFAEIEEMLNMQAKIVCKTRETASDTDKPMLSFIAMLDGRIYSLRVVEEHIAELKKKYTESEKDDG